MEGYDNIRSDTGTGEQSGLGTALNDDSEHRKRSPPIRASQRKSLPALFAGTSSSSSNVLSRKTSRVSCPADIENESEIALENEQRKQSDQTQVSELSKASRRISVILREPSLKQTTAESNDRSRKNSTANSIYSAHSVTTREYLLQTLFTWTCAGDGVTEWHDGAMRL
jgi:hypothetical protein